MAPSCQFLDTCRMLLRVFLCSVGLSWFSRPAAYELGAVYIHLTSEKPSSAKSPDLFKVVQLRGAHRLCCVARCSLP